MFVDEPAKTITVEIFGDVAIESLIPEIVISGEASVSPNSNLVQDFSRPLVYTVEAQDGSMVEYTVSVVLVSNANTMLSFVFEAAKNDGLASDIVATIDQDAKKVSATLPSGTDSRSLIPTIEFSEKASVEPKSGEQQDFSKVLRYAVQAESRLRNNYDVSISVNISDVERNALKALHLANPSNTLGWDFSDDANVTWEGVGIFNGKVTSLRIGDDKMITEIPMEFGNLVNLTFLTINRNRQIETFPESFKNLVNIEHLDLVLTGLRGFPTGITFMTNLKTLNLSNNTIGALPQEIENLTNLEEFRASNGNLTNFPVGLTKLTNLKTLYLHSNFDVKSIPSEIGNLTNLESLTLHGNSLSNIPETIGNLVKLEYLDIAVNDLTAIPSELGNLVDLKILTMRTNSLTNIPSELGQLTKLTKLAVHDNALTTIPQEICDLESSGTEITKDDNVICE